MDFTTAQPEMVKSLALINTAARVPEAGRTKMQAAGKKARRDGMAAVIPGALASWFTPEFMHERPDLMDRINKTLLQQQPRVNASMWDEAANLDIYDKLSGITCPTLVIVGEKDVSTPIAI